MTAAAPFVGTAFVTGASGIVGSALVQSLLKRGVAVVALIRDEDPRSEFYRSGADRRVVQVPGSLEDLPVLERVIVQHEIDVVFHLGAQTQVRHAQRQPLTTLESNIRGTYHLLEAVRRAVPQPRAVVVASSDKAYGESATLPYTEAHPLAGRNIYDASKSASDLLATAYATSYGLPIGIARCANIYGPGDLNWDRIVPGTTRALIEDRRPLIRSDGTLQRDYVHVRDAVSAYEDLAAALVEGHQHGEAFNFGTGVPVSVLDLVSRIREAVGSNLEPIVLDDAPHEIQSQWLDSSKAKRELGWSASLSLPEGLAQTVPWYLELLRS